MNMHTDTINPSETTTEQVESCPKDDLGRAELCEQSYEIISVQRLRNGYVSSESDPVLVGSFATLASNNTSTQTSIVNCTSTPQNIHFQDRSGSIPCVFGVDFVVEYLDKLVGLPRKCWRFIAGDHDQDSTTSYLEIIGFPVLLPENHYLRHTVDFEFTSQDCQWITSEPWNDWSVLSKQQPQYSISRSQYLLTKYRPISLSFHPNEMTLQHRMKSVSIHGQIRRKSPITSSPTSSFFFVELECRLHHTQVSASIDPDTNIYTTFVIYNSTNACEILTHWTQLRIHTWCLFVALKGVILNKNNDEHRRRMLVFEFGTSKSFLLDREEMDAYLRGSTLTQIASSFENDSFSTTGMVSFMGPPLSETYSQSVVVSQRGKCTQGWPCLSYEGVITRIEDAELAIIELDHRILLFANSYAMLNSGLGLRVGATMRLSNVHLVSYPQIQKTTHAGSKSKIMHMEDNTQIFFVTCGTSTIELVSDSPSKVKANQQILDGRYEPLMKQPSGLSKYLLNCVAKGSYTQEDVVVAWYYTRLFRGRFSTTLSPRNKLDYKRLVKIVNTLLKELRCESRRDTALAYHAEFLQHDDCCPLTRRRYVLPSMKELKQIVSETKTKLPEEPKLFSGGTYELHHDKQSNQQKDEEWIIGVLQGDASGQLLIKDDYAQILIHIIDADVSIHYLNRMCCVKRYDKLTETFGVTDAKEWIARSWIQCSMSDLICLENSITEGTADDITLGSIASESMLSTSIAPTASNSLWSTAHSTFFGQSGDDSKSCQFIVFIQHINPTSVQVVEGVTGPKFACLTTVYGVCWNLDDYALSQRPNALQGTIEFSGGGMQWLPGVHVGNVYLIRKLKEISMDKSGENVFAKVGSATQFRCIHDSCTQTSDVLEALQSSLHSLLGTDYNVTQDLQQHVFGIKYQKIDELIDQLTSECKNSMEVDDNTPTPKKTKQKKRTKWNLIRNDANIEASIVGKDLRFWEEEFATTNLLQKDISTDDIKLFHKFGVGVGCSRRMLFLALATKKSEQRWNEHQDWETNDDKILGIYCDLGNLVNPVGLTVGTRVKIQNIAIKYMREENQYSTRYRFVGVMQPETNFQISHSRVGTQDTQETTNLEKSDAVTKHTYLNQLLVELTSEPVVLHVTVKQMVSLRLRSACDKCDSICVLGNCRKMCPQSSPVIVGSAKCLVSDNLGEATLLVSDLKSVWGLLNIKSTKEREMITRKMCSYGEIVIENFGGTKLQVDAASDHEASSRTPYDNPERTTALRQLLKGYGSQAVNRRYMVTCRLRKLNGEEFEYSIKTDGHSTEVSGTCRVEDNSSVTKGFTILGMAENQAKRSQFKIGQIWYPTLVAPAMTLECIYLRDISISERCFNLLEELEASAS